MDKNNKSPNKASSLLNNLIGGLVTNEQRKIYKKTKYEVI